MPWYAYFLQFFAGVLLTNAVPHSVHGLSGARFQSPFGKPPGIGESSAETNVYWGFMNLGLGGFLFAKFTPQDAASWALVSAGALLMGRFVARRFSKVRSTQASPTR